MLQQGLKWPTTINTTGNLDVVIVWKGVKRVPKGDGTVQIYPLVNPFPPCRTHASTLALATDAINNPRVRHIMGVKGPSILFLLPGFNLITGLIPDYMHCLLLGVVYQFLDLWLNAVGEAYYIKKKHHLFTKSY